MTNTRTATRRALQVLQNAALLRGQVRVASIAQGFQLLLQALQRLDLRLCLPQMPIEQRIDLVACQFRFGLKMLQGAYVIQRHPQRAAMPDEQQLLGIRFAVSAVVAICTLRWSKQLFTLVVTDRFDFASRSFRQFSDLHFRLVQ